MIQKKYKINHLCNKCSYDNWRFTGDLETSNPPICRVVFLKNEAFMDDALVQRWFCPDCYSLDIFTDEMLTKKELDIMKKFVEYLDDGQLIMTADLVDPNLYIRHYANENTSFGIKRKHPKHVYYKTTKKTVRT